MLTLGFETKVINNLKTRKKIYLLAKYYGFSQCPQFNNRHAKMFVDKFMDMEIKNKETFKELMFDHLRERKLISYKNVLIDEHQLTICNLPAAKFYQSPEWKALRYKALVKYGNRCMACGRAPKDRVIIHVDHILPRSTYPEHALTLKNLQILCEDCNISKSNKDETDWR